MNVLLVCVSVSHGNTRRVADVMAEVLGATVVEPEEVTAADLAAGVKTIAGSARSMGLEVAE